MALGTRREETGRTSAGNPFASHDALFAGSRLFLVGLSRSGRIERLGKCALEPYGFAANEALGRAFVDGPWWRDIPATRVLIQRGLDRAREGESFHETLVLATAGGERRDLELLIDPIGVGEGVVDFLLAMGTDVTEVRRCERELEAERTRVDGVFAAADVLVWRLALAAGPFASDPESVHSCGLVPLEIGPAASGTCRERIHRDDVERVEGAWRRSAEAGEPFETTFRALASDGYRWLISRGEIERDATGAATRLAGVTVDITSQRAATEALATNEARYRRLFDSTQEGFCVFEPVRDAQGSVVDVRYVETNPAFERQTGLRDVVGRRLRGEVLPDIEPLWIERMRHVAESGEPLQFIERAEALERWFDVSLTRIEGITDIRLGCLFKDVTERELADLRLKRLAADLAVQDERKNAFLATLAHELRNPLAPVRHALHLLECEANEPAEREELRAMMERQVGHLSRLVDDLLDVSRLSNDKLVLAERTVRADELIANAIETARPLVDAHRHTLTTTLPATPFALHGDPVRLAQVLSNLLTNAARYTPEGGRIEVSIASDETGMRFSVGDDGVGLDPLSRERIFEMFSQVPTDTPDGHGGLGLGLTLARTLVEMHEGELRVASAGLGEGSLFTMWLPPSRRADAVEATTPVPGAVDAAGGVALSVLVVDDNRDTAATLAKILRRYRHEVIVAHDGESALARARAAAPEVLVLDIGLPDVSGHDVARTLRAEGSEATLVALTGWGAEADIARSRAAGFDHHLTKPVRAAVLLELLRDIASGRER